MWRPYNNNPIARRVGDCAIRAVALALDTDWETAYIEMAVAGLLMGEMPDINNVWGAVLRQHGFYREALPRTCPDCFTVRDFCREHRRGVYVLGTDGHVVTAIDGDWYDIWDSGDETVLYFWYRKDE